MRLCVFNPGSPAPLSLVVSVRWRGEREGRRIKSGDGDEWMQTEGCGVQTGKGDRFSAEESHLS